jgi:predicted transcriptional regulator
MKIIDPENCPGIFIPCADLENLKSLIGLLYDCGIIEENSFQLIRVPEEFMEEINKSVLI